MKPSPKPLPHPIPLDYAEALQYDPSNISHINAGRRRLTPKWRILKVMASALTDERLRGLSVFDLAPDLKDFLPYICLACPRDREKEAPRPNKESGSLRTPG